MERRDDHQNSNPFEHSLADLMAGVMAIFALVAAAYIVIASQTQRSLENRTQRAEDTAERGRKELIDKINSLTDINDCIKVTTGEADDGGNRDLITNVDIRESKDGVCADLAFRRGKGELNEKEDAKLLRTLRRLAILAFEKTLCRDEEFSEIATINLEGHTDRLRFTSDCTQAIDPFQCNLSANLKLSSERAQSVYKAILVELDSDHIYANPTDQLSTSGECYAKLIDRLVVAGRGFTRSHKQASQFLYGEKEKVGTRKQRDEALQLNTKKHPMDNAEDRIVRIKVVFRELASEKSKK